MGATVTVLSDPGAKEAQAKVSILSGRRDNRIISPPAPPGPSTPPLPAHQPPPKESPGVVPDDPMVPKETRFFPPPPPPPPPVPQPPPVPVNLPAPPQFLRAVCSTPPPPPPPPAEEKLKRNKRKHRHRRDSGDEGSDRERDDRHRSASRSHSRNRSRSSSRRPTRSPSLDDGHLETISSSSDDDRPNSRHHRSKSKDKAGSSPDEETPPPAVPSPEPGLSLESRIQSILRGAEEEVMKVVKSEKKGATSPEIVCLDDQPPTSSNHRTTAPKKPPTQASTPSRRRRRSRFDQPGPAVAQPPPRAWIPPPSFLSRLPPPANLRHPPPGFPPIPPPPFAPPMPPWSMAPPPFPIPPPPLPPPVPRVVRVSTPSPYSVPPPAVTIPVSVLPVPPEPPEIKAEKIVQFTLKALTSDLKKVLSRDVNRRFVEAAVVSSVDDWWKDQLDKEAESKIEDSARETALRHLSSGNAESLNTIAEKATAAVSSGLTELFGDSDASLGGLPGFGFKASMPKLPSFKKKIITREEDSDRDKSPTPGNESISSKTISSSSEDEDEEEAGKEETKAQTDAPLDESYSSKTRSYVSSSDEDEEAPSTSEAKSDSKSATVSRDPTLSPSQKKKTSSSSSYTSGSDSELDETESSNPDLLSKPSLPLIPNKSDEDLLAKDKDPELVRKTTPSEDQNSRDSIPEEAGLQPLSPPAFGAPVSEVKENKAPETAISPAPFKAPEEPLGQPAKKRPRLQSRVYPQRSEEDELALLDLTGQGIDVEDMAYLQRAWEQSLAAEAAAKAKTVPEPGTMSETHWYPHPEALAASAKSAAGEHVSGCARCDPVYRLSHREKRSFMRRASAVCQRTAAQNQLDVAAARQVAQMGREARAVQRRLLTSLGNEAHDSELLKTNQLKLRKKLIRFGRSHIHGWGLFALEDIGADEMIVEYVGQKVRLQVAERREFHYQRRGIGSSYLFRVDSDTVIDATGRGNMARFINHSCQPSCYAKIITVEGSKRIVIYSKIAIKAGEEITYDYKFPLEDEKIPCLCRAPSCRGTLN